MLGVHWGDVHKTHDVDFAYDPDIDVGVADAQEINVPNVLDWGRRNPVPEGLSQSGSDLQDVAQVDVLFLEVFDGAQFLLAARRWFEFAHNVSTRCFPIGRLCHR
jgi:hypothetical protein